MLLAVVAVGALARPAVAQFNPNTTTSTDIVKITSFGPFDPYGVYKGKLMASPGTPTVDLLCDDFVGKAHFNVPYNVDITRYDATSAQFNTNTKFGFAAFTSYEKAAFLSNYFAGLTNAGVVQDLNSAIWHLFTPAQPSGVRAGESFWTGLLASNQWQNIDLTQYFIVSDAVKGSLSQQEFIMHTVPEPGSVLMLSTGLLSLVGLARIRRRRNSA